MQCLAGRHRANTLAGRPASFTGIWQPLLAVCSAASAAAWLDLVEQTGLGADGIGMSDHFLYIGRKR